MCIGLKLWSINDNYIEHAKKLFKEGIYDYIELYAVPNSYSNCIDMWKNINVPYIVHAPHFMHGMNPARQECIGTNIEFANEAIRFADTLNSKYIIFHPGAEGKTENTIKFFKKINDKRILVENKPYHGLPENVICNGSTVEEIKQIIDDCGVGFCFDIPHAICSAKSHNQDCLELIKEFLEMSPKMFHLSDGDVDTFFDEHSHLGKGNYPLEKIVPYLPQNMMVTIETEKQSNVSLDDFVEDVNIFKIMISDIRK
ncbi:MAG: sugar phosphate isomerase/epimerase [Candidatus Omnitrophica bacterium]|nr:sugar phosphate isomerase/epimerase [Candidatus Omnitrophota bacterium]